MADDRTTRVWLSIVECARRESAPVAVRHVCLACVRTVPVDAAALVLGATLGARITAFATDSLAERMADAEVMCGEGPTVEALAEIAPVLVDDLGSPAVAGRWPAFAAEAAGTRAGAVFALPLRVGAVCLGVLDLYRSTPGSLRPAELADALSYADAALTVALDDQAALMGGPTVADGAARRFTNGSLAHSGQIHQAAGMVSVQLALPIADAMVRLRAYAYARGRRLDEVARAVVERRLRLTDATDDGLDVADFGGDG